MAQEALTNAERHAGATVVEVELEVARDRTELRVRDDGGGFDPGRATRTGDPASQGLGLRGMAERARLVGGELDVRSAPGRRHLGDAEDPMIRVLIADDHGIVRSGLRMLIDRQTDMEVVAEATDGVSALESTQAERPDVAVLDVSMPRMTGLQAAREIRSHAPDTRVLLLSMHDDEHYFVEGLDAGAAGYVLKRAADTDLIEALRTVAGRQDVPLERGPADADGASGSTGARPDLDDPLTPRELEVVKLIAEAYTNRQIAETLRVSEKTVESHRANVLSKLGMRDRVELARYAVRRGLVEP